MLVINNPKKYPITIFVIPTRTDCPTTDEQLKKTKTRYGNLHCRSVIGALLYVS